MKLRICKVCETKAIGKIPEFTVHPSFACVSFPISEMIKFWIDQDFLIEHWHMMFIVSM